MNWNYSGYFKMIWHHTSRGMASVTEAEKKLMKNKFRANCSKKTAEFQAPSGRGAILRNKRIILSSDLKTFFSKQEAISSNVCRCL